MNIYNSFKWLNSFKNPREILLLEGVTNTKKKVLVTKNERGLCCNVDFTFFKLLYDKSSIFKIYDNSIVVIIKHHIVKNGNSFHNRECNAYMFESLNFEIIKDKYFKYFSLIDTVFLIDFLKNHKTDFTITLNKYCFEISIINIDNSNYLVVKCVEKIDFKKFKHFVNNIIVSLGFLTGKFYKKEEFYFHSNSIEENNDVEFFYRNGDRKFDFLRPFTSQPISYSWQFNDDFEPSEVQLNQWSSSFGEITFSNFVSLLIEKPKFYFSIRMLFQFFELSFIARQAALFVILETITAEINNEYNSFCIDKIIIKDQALVVLENNKKTINDTDYEILENAINELDSKILENIINFEWAFKSMNISLSNADKKLFKERNKIFHGKIIANPFEINLEEDSYDLEEDFISNSNRLYVLISKLILKRVGFTGYILNHSKLFEPEIRESYFLKI